MWADVRLAARVLLKEKAFTIPSVVALVLGIAANTTVFTIVNGILFRPLPFHEPDRVVVLGARSANSGRSPFNVSLPEFEHWRTATRSFDGLAAFAQRPMNLADDVTAADQISGAYVSANAFDLLGRRPILGRGFTVDDDRPGAEPVVLLSHSMWRVRYHSAPDVIGRTIRVNGVPAQVVGVMPDGFAFPETSQLWQPMSRAPEESRTSRTQRTISAFGRLASRVTIEEARADLAVANSALGIQYPDTNANIQTVVQRFRERNITRPLRVLLSLLTGAVAFVLLIGCANVANLLLARAATREREVALRMSMGASGWIVVRQLLLESLLLAIVAGVVGLGLSVFGVRAFARAVDGLTPYWLQFSMDGRVFAFVAAVCLGTSILFGLLPALQTSRTNLLIMLNEASRGSAGGVRSRRWTAALVTGQLAMTLVLLTGAGLMMRSVLVHFQTDTGVDTANLVQLRLSLAGARYATADQRNDFYRRFTASVKAVPGLRATITSAAPRDGAAAVNIAVDGQPSDDAERAPITSSLLIGPGYFGALGVRGLRGREFTAADGVQGRNVVIVNEQFVSRYFQNNDPIGRRIRVTDRDESTPEREWLTIVGIAPNVRQRPTEDGNFDAVMYVPYAANPIPLATILARSDRGVASVATQIRQQVRSLDPDLPLFEVMTLDERLAEAVWEREVFGLMLGIFAAIALTLAAVGLYGVTAYSVSQRTREIGIRIALGAHAKQVYWLVTRRASVQLAVGLALGLLGGVGVGVAVQNLQSDVAPVDPVTFITVVGLLIVVALVACLIPARRATRLDPVAALRSE